MKLFHKIINKIHLKTKLLTLKDKYKSPEKPIVQDIRQREFELFGKEKINQQRLYEKWVVKDTWRLLSEALPLLSGFDPANTHLQNNSEIYKNKLNEHWSHAKQCVEQGLLPVTNRDNKPEDWQVHPFDAYRWAKVSRIEMPEALVTLMEFVLKTVKQTVVQGDSITDSDNTDNKRECDEDRERVLGTALAILSAYSERCRNNNGQVQTDRILEIFNEKGKFWFGDRYPDLSKDAMRDLIDKWINTVP